MPGLLISATRKSSGKTTVAAGLCAALTARGHTVQPFKKGPDYIDPMWLTRAAGTPCINLDFNTMDENEIHTVFARYAGEHHGDTCAIIEGAKGLFDGVDPAGGDSNAALAKLLDAAVLLVVDARGITRGVAPLLRGYEVFAREVNAGALALSVVLNNVGGARHESKLRAAIENYTDLTVLGALHADRALAIAERHLGLITDRENANADNIIAKLNAAVTAQINVDAIAKLAAHSAPSPSRSPTPSPDITIAIARDAAFGFYYADDLRAFETYGARLLPFDVIHDSRPPDADGLYLGGGFPETHAAALSQNRGMRDAVRQFVQRGGAVYAECGGLIYLSQSITSTAGDTCAMAGALPLRVTMHDRPVGRGYVVLEDTGDGLWHKHLTGAAIHAHEFHYSQVIVDEPSNIKFAWRVRRGYGIDGDHDGVVFANTLANYAHLRNTAAYPWVKYFVDFVRECKRAE